MRKKTVRDKSIDAAIADGRLVPEARERWIRNWDANPKATAAVLKELAPGLRPEQQAVLDAAVGQQAGLPDEWFRARRRSADGARPPRSVHAGVGVRTASASPPRSPAKPKSSPAAKGKAAEAIDWPEFKRPSPRRRRITMDQAYGQ